MHSETRITKPKLDPREFVNTAVWVRKPGPMAEVAIRNAAPIKAPRVVFFSMTPMCPFLCECF